MSNLITQPCPNGCYIKPILLKGCTSVTITAFCCCHFFLHLFVCWLLLHFIKSKALVWQCPQITNPVQKYSTAQTSLHGMEPNITRNISSLRMQSTTKNKKRQSDYPRIRCVPVRTIRNISDISHSIAVWRFFLAQSWAAITCYWRFTGCFNLNENLL